jgi:hypothetical protein
MRIVIQCAATKAPHAGSLPSEDGRRVLFVADPANAPPRSNIIYARPDDEAGSGRTWRQILLDYNTVQTGNPSGLLPAYQLYRNQVYERLVSKFGPSKVFVLSAGWGLVSAHFLLPDYDITFSPAAPLFKRRRKSDSYRDFCMLPNDPDDVAFIGGKDYLPLFSALTDDVRAPKIVFFNSSLAPKLPIGYQPIRYATATRTNWHYECANDLIEGRFHALAPG